MKIFYNIISPIIQTEIPSLSCLVERRGICIAYDILLGYKDDNSVKGAPRSIKWYKIVRFFRLQICVRSCHFLRVIKLAFQYRFQKQCHCNMITYFGDVVSVKQIIQCKTDHFYGLTINSTNQIYILLEGSTSFYSLFLCVK